MAKSRSCSLSSSTSAFLVQRRPIRTIHISLRMAFGIQNSFSLIIAISLLILCLCSVNVIILHKAGREKECNVFEGSWVCDASHPVYNSTSCLFIRKEFDCIKYGRTDLHYLQYRWQPNGCDLPRFDGQDFLRRFKDKKIMFIGDSVSLNHYQSLVCLLHAAAPRSNITQTRNGSISSFTFQDYGVSMMLHSNFFLVDIEKGQNGPVLDLDSLKSGDMWKDMDVLIFNTWLWWYRRGTKQPWDYIKEGDTILKDMDRMVAFRKGLTTWAKWVDSEVNHEKTRVFFQGLSPSHYHGREWNELGVKNCLKETRPLNGSTYPNGLPKSLTVVKEVLSTVSKPVYLLDVTNLSQLRKDAHPSIYNGFKGMDCTHWCVPGLADTWNQLLYASLIERTPQ